MGTHNSGAGKDVVKRGLNGCCVGEETPVEIQNSQETSELDDGLGKVTGLKICDLFQERLGTQRRDFVSQE
jgi:hypothetical protein